MSRPTSTVSGLVSGIDWETTIQQLMAIERRRVTLLDDRKQDNETKLNLWAQIQSKLLALQGTMEGMDLRSEFAAKSASSSDTSIVTVSADAAASVGSHTVEVVQLAKAHRLAAQGWADKNATGVGDSGGDFVIEINGETITIADADLASTTTLEQLRNLINSSADNNGSVTASILNDGSGSNPYRLVLTANGTGTENAISISSNPTSLDFSGTRIDEAETETGWTGTSAMTTAGTYAGTLNKAFTFTVAGSGAQTIGSGDITVDWVDSLGNTGSIVIPNGYGGANIAVAEGVELSFGAGTLVGGDVFSVDVFHPNVSAAQDARVKIDSIYMSKSSNTITDVLEGVTLDLLSAEPGTTVDITVSNDTEAVKSKIEEFVNAYNTAMSDIGTFSAYDEENETAAPLLGDGFLSEVRSVLSRLTAQAMEGLPDDAQYDSLAVIGIRASARGLLSIDNSKLDEALEENYDDVVDLFTKTFTSGDSKIGWVSSNEHTQPGEYSIVVNYDGSGNLTSATINGQAATIDGQLIHAADDSSAKGLTLSFTSPGSGPGSINTTIRFGKGVAGTVAGEMVLLNDSEAGTIYFATENINDTIESLDRQIESWNVRLAGIEERFRHQFSSLETLLSRLRSQSSYLTSVLGNL